MNRDVRFGKRAWIDALMLGTLFVALTAWSWRTWPDVLIDFGRELYTPWRLAEGDVLYRDVASLFGPLSQYLNATLFRAFGTSYTTLLMANLAILAGLGVVVYRFFAAACDRFTAVVAVGVMFTVFGFANPLVGSFNFIAPYAHEATHGLVLTVVMLYAVQRFTATGATVWAATAGCCLGLTVLTKPEIAVAACASAAVGLVLLARIPALARLRSRRALAAFGAAVLAGPIAFFVYFLTVMPVVDAVRAVLGAWTPLVTAPAATNAFYAEISGFNAPAANLLRMGLLAAVAAVAVAVWLALDRIAARDRSRERLIALVTSVYLVAIFLIAPVSLIDDVGRILPVLVLAIMAVLARRLAAEREHAEAVTRLMPLVMWSVLALALLAKTVLNVRLSGYGFVLALPATLVSVAAGTWLVPTGLRGRGGSGVPFRSFALTSTGALIVLHLLSSHAVTSAKTFPVGSGGDRMLTYEPPLSPLGPFVAEALRQIERLVPPNGTVLVLPEGVTLNYLTRRRNPTPYINFMLPELAAFGEPSILAALSQHPPDLVVLAHKDTSEYGVGFFGRDPRYGRRIMDWVARRYETAVRIGAEPLRGPKFGITILRPARALERR